MKKKLNAACCVVLAVCMAFCMNPMAYAGEVRMQEETEGENIQTGNLEAEENHRAIVTPGNGSGQQIVNNELNRLGDGKLYYFDAQGRKVTKKGWRTLSAKRYIQIGASGYVIAKMEQAGGSWKFYAYNDKKNQWEKQRDTWNAVRNKEYYFNKKGNCTKIYNTKTKKCQRYKGGKMHTVKKDVSALGNGKLYYFNARGVRDTKKGWKKASCNRYIQVGKSGYVTAKIQKGKGVFRYYRYDYHRKEWVGQKKGWLTVDKKKFYFGGAGKCTRLYNVSTRKCYTYKNGKRSLTKNDVRKIGKTEYYFGANGVRVSDAGMYMTCHGKLVYVRANGVVAKRISGQVQAYTMAGAKVASCRVRDGAYMCYYNGTMEPRRKIDTSKMMVALTYDDGPSQYTPEILSILRQHGGVATFFVVGSRVSGYADTVKSAYDMGCEIGNHTYSHQVLTKVGTPTIQSQVGATNSAVQNVIGVSPVVMRPPGGGHNPEVRSAVGMPVIMWSIDTLDWKTKNAASTQAAILNKVRDGDIVLMHDLYSQTAEASRVVIPELVRRGYQLVTVSELSDCRGAMAAGGVYSSFR